MWETKRGGGGEWHGSYSIRELFSLFSSMTCYLLSFPSYCPSGIFYYKPPTVAINLPWVACHGCWVEVSWIQRIIAVDTFKHHLSVWYYNKGIESCLLKVSVVECLSIPLVNSHRHLIDIWINTQSTSQSILGQHWSHTWLTSWLTCNWDLINGWSMAGRVSTDSYLLIATW